MTDKVQKIREEVERLKGWNNNVRNSTRHMTLQEEDFNRGKHSSYLEILNFIDSLQEEPTTSVWHDANILPSNPKAVIVEHNEYSTSICRAEQMSRIKGAKWAYVEDLLKL